MDTRIEPPASAGEGAGGERRAAAAVAEAAAAEGVDEDVKDAEVVDCGVMCNVSSSSRRRVLPGLSPTQSSIT